MKVEDKAKLALASGFAAIAKQFSLPGEFSSEVLAATDLAVKKTTLAHMKQAGRRDATDLPWMTLDPASSTDLDQAFTLSQDGDEIVLHYALSDVGAFVAQDSPIEKEAWRRGVTIYGMTEKTPLYPKLISQGAASLLPDGPRPAILVEVGIRKHGDLRLRNVEPIIVASRAKLAYDAVDLTKIPFIESFANRFSEGEIERGAVRVDFPQQEVVADDKAPGGVRLELRARSYSERVNSTLSLAVNIALGSMMKEAGIGLFRVMDEPNTIAMNRLRRTARVLGIHWMSNESLRDLQRRLDSNDMTHQRFLMEARRAGGRARYATLKTQSSPWHAAIAAIYAHATAPMRRLADRYVLDLACLLFRNDPVPAALQQKIDDLSEVMEMGEGRASNIDRAVIDLLEAVSLQDRIGEILEAEVVDVDSGIVQTFDTAIRAKATKLYNIQNGDRVHVRIQVADPATRKVKLEVCGG